MWNNNYYEWGAPDFEWLEKELDSGIRSVVISHQPPGSGTLSEEHEERWKELRYLTNYVYSIHGHVHHYSYKYEDDTNTGIFTVDRVDKGYGIIYFTDDEIRHERISL